jgi:hypothetical protein
LTGPRVAAVATALLGLLLGLATCGGPAPSTPVTPSSSGWSAGPSVGPSPSPATTGGAPGSAASGLAVEADPGLFAFIGDAAGGLTFRYDAATTAQVATDPGLALNAVGLAIGLYTVPSQDPVVDFAIVSIVHLRDPSVGDDWFRSYRDSYDAAACAQAGGVDRHSEATIGTNQVFIGACAGGAFTYHVRLSSRPIVVSITAAGPARLGETIAGSAGQ